MVPEPALTGWRERSTRAGAVVVACLALAAPVFAGASPCSLLHDQAEVEARTDPRTAARHYGLAIECFVRASDVTGEVTARIRLSVVLFGIGDLAGARLHEGRAVEVADGHGDPVLRAQARLQFAWIAIQRHERLAAAHRVLHEARALVFPDGPPRVRGRILSGLGNVAFLLGRHDEALAHFATAAELARRHGHTDLEAVARWNIVTTQRRQMEWLPDRGRLGELLAAARETLSIAEASRSPERMASAHRTIGDLLASDAATRASAERHYRKAVEFSRRGRDAGGLADSLWAAGRFWVPTAPERGRALIDEALRVAIDSGRPAAVAYAWRQQLRLAWQSPGSVEVVTAQSRRALSALETLRAQQTGDTGAEAFGAWTLDYYWLTGRLLRDADPDRRHVAFAFEVTERMRARALLDALLRPAGTTPDSAAAVVSERRGRILAELSSAQRRLLDPQVIGQARDAAAAEVERLEREERELRAADGSSDPADRVSRATFAGLDEIERALGPDEAMLSFAIGLDRTFAAEPGGGGTLFVVSRRGTSVLHVPDRVRLVTAVPIFRGLVDQGSAIDGAVSVRLYDLLLREALQRLPAGVTRLVLVTDGPLHQLPFAALKPALDAPTIAETHRIAVAPSATVWLRLRQRSRRGEATGALIVADPFEGRGVGQTPQERAFFFDTRTVGPLRFARDEGRTVAARIGNGSRLLIGASASESAFRQAIPSAYRVLHFATHAIVDEETPDRSAVFLAGSGRDDGLLQAREIADLRLDGQIVVLSACRSMGGAVLAGEGTMSLSRAFLEAGAGTVVGTLWSIRDDHAARFFDWFYRDLSLGRPVGAALRSARREAIAAGMPPATWASVTVIGDDAAVVAVTAGRSPSRWQVVLVSVAGVAVAVAGAALWRRRRLEPRAGR